MVVELYEKDESLVFKPQLQPMYALADLNSHSNPTVCFFAVFIDEIEDILIRYMNDTGNKNSVFYSRKCNLQTF